MGHTESVLVIRISVFSEECKQCSYELLFFFFLNCSFFTSFFSSKMMLGIKIKMILAQESLCLQSTDLLPNVKQRSSV